MRHRLVVGFTAAAAIGMAAWCLLPDTVIAQNTDLDEGVYLMVARLLHRGYTTDAFFFDQFWLFPKIITAAFAFFGDSLIVARLTIFAFSLAGLLGIAVLSYQLGAGWMAATAAIFIGAIDPLYIRGSRMTLADVPAATCIVWALVLVFLFEKNQRRVWIGLSGFCAGCALVMKPFALGFVASVIIILLNQRIRRENGRLKFDPAVGGDLLTFGAAAILIAAPFINIFHPVQEYQRVLGFHLAERDWMIKRVDDRWHGLLVFARLNLPIILFAISGLISLRPLRISIMALLIGELVTAGILLDMPPWIHHYILILPLLVVFCVVGFSPGLTRFTHLISDFSDGRRPSSGNKLGPIFFAGAILVSVVDLPWLIKYDHRERWPHPLRIEPVVQYVEQTFGPNDSLISDDALVPYLAKRNIPPAAINFVFGDVMKFDRPSLQRFEQIAQDDHVAGIITTTRYPRNPQLMSWIEENFPISREIGTHHPDELTARIYITDKQQR